MPVQYSQLSLGAGGGGGGSFPGAAGFQSPNRRSFPLLSLSVTSSRFTACLFGCCVFSSAIIAMILRQQHLNVLYDFCFSMASPPGVVYFPTFRGAFMSFYWTRSFRGPSSQPRLESQGSIDTRHSAAAIPFWQSTFWNLDVIDVEHILAFIKPAVLNGHNTAIGPE